jgi:hypothetical protein
MLATMTETSEGLIPEEAFYSNGGLKNRGVNLEGQMQGPWESYL